METVIALLMSLLVSIAIAAKAAKHILESLLLKNTLKREAAMSDNPTAFSVQSQASPRARRWRVSFGVFSMFMGVAYLWFLIFTPLGAQPVTAGDLASIAQSLVLVYTGLSLLRD